MPAPRFRRLVGPAGRQQNRACSAFTAYEAPQGAGGAPAKAKSRLGAARPPAVRPGSLAPPRPPARPWSPSALRCPPARRPNSAACRGQLSRRVQPPGAPRGFPWLYPLCHLICALAKLTFTWPVTKARGQLSCWRPTGKPYSGPHRHLEGTVKEKRRSDN